MSLSADRICDIRVKNLIFPDKTYKYSKTDMFKRRLYYGIKPFFPQRFRMFVRRIFASRKLVKNSDRWPISESAAVLPNNWNDWPDDKKFAVVLTHDVEGQRGYDRVRKLAELEMKYGFRSSFNFIPEGEYKVDKELRDWLTSNGFEVGVHDLKHDGKLFSSEKNFIEGAKKINQYLEEWGAVGYRSGFMLRNLKWMKRLNIEYDSSTFDTDPFEPMPDGVDTIFPFWIGNGSHEKKPGFVELPYTLPQDSTVFLLFKKTTTAIWTDKLNWIVEHGGMALLNVHPDYIQFPGDKASATTFPHERYCEYLAHISQNFRENYWQPIPKQLASWYKEQHVLKPETGKIPSGKLIQNDLSFPALKGKRVAVFLFSYYPGDPRPRRAAEAMVMAGMEVDLFCLRETEDVPVEETINGVNVFRFPVKKKRESKLSYILQYSYFFLACAYHVTIRTLSKRYDVIHVHNMPDFLIFASFVPKLFGAKCILDLHDPMPELMRGIYDLDEASLFVRALKLVERMSIGFSKFSITPNIAFKKLFVSRSCRAEKMKIVMNTPEQSIFDPDKIQKRVVENRNVFKIMHHGSIVYRHGLDILVEAVAKVKESIPEATLEIYGSRTPYLDVVFEQARQSGIENSVNYHGILSQSEIANEIRNCALGIVPNRRSSFTELNFPTRLFEYLCMNKPVIAPATVGIKDYFSDNQMLYFEPNSSSDLANKIIWAKNNPDAVERIVTEGKKVYRKHLWKEEREKFLNYVSDALWY